MCIKLKLVRDSALGALNCSSGYSAEQKYMQSTEKELLREGKIWISKLELCSDAAVCHTLVWYGNGIKEHWFKV